MKKKLSVVNSLEAFKNTLMLYDVISNLFSIFFFISKAISTDKFNSSLFNNLFPRLFYSSLLHLTNSKTVFDNSSTHLTFFSLVFLEYASFHKRKNHA